MTTMTAATAMKTEDNDGFGDCGEKNREDNEMCFCGQFAEPVAQSKCQNPGEKCCGRCVKCLKLLRKVKTMKNCSCGSIIFLLSCALIFESTATCGGANYLTFRGVKSFA